MIIVFTGGGTGGHFYPIIAIAEAMRDAVREKHLLEPRLYYLSPTPFDEKALFENDITYISIPAGKLRRYFSFSNVTDMFITLIGTIKAIFTLFRLYPDVVMGKGGYGSIPTLIAARLLRIPVIIHESDAKPGRASLFAAKFAKKVAISYDSAAAFFPTNVQNKIARTGIPIRKALMRIEPEGARQYLKLEKDIPTILVLGGSQGSVKINEILLSALPYLVPFANIINQTGRANLKDVQALSKVILAGNPHIDRYHPIDYLNEVSLQRAAGIADIVISRAGSNSIAEISVWRKPSIIIPIPELVSHDQRTNAYAYAQTGAAVVIEEENFTSNLLVSEIKRIINDPELAKRMASKSEGFTDKDAARILADELLSISLTHEV